MGRKAGLSDEKLRALPGNDLTPLNDTERLVIELSWRADADIVECFRRFVCPFTQSIFRGTADATRSADRVRKLSRPVESTLQRRERQSLLWR